LLGNKQQSNRIYNWTRDGLTLHDEPYPANSNIVTFFRA
jgi:hypothetical protein